MIQRFRDMALGDTWPYKYFRVYEFDLVGSDFIKVEADLSAFISVKISIRHEDNKSDINDHAKDDIYTNVILDSGNICHWEPGPTDISKLGEYKGRLTGVKATGEIWHSPDWFVFNATPKSSHGREQI